MPANARTAGDGMRRPSEAAAQGTRVSGDVMRCPRASAEQGPRAYCVCVAWVGSGSTGAGCVRGCVWGIAWRRLLDRHAGHPTHLHAQGGAGWCVRWKRCSQETSGLYVDAYVGGQRLCVRGRQGVVRGHHAPFTHAYKYTYIYIHKVHPTRLELQGLALPEVAHHQLLRHLAAPAPVGRHRPVLAHLLLLTTLLRPCIATCTRTHTYMQSNMEST